jgi:hypothetical protein
LIERRASDFLFFFIYYQLLIESEGGIDTPAAINTPVIKERPTGKLIFLKKKEIQKRYSRGHQDPFCWPSRVTSQVN